jgi:hypothetical protein
MNTICNLQATMINLQYCFDIVSIAKIPDLMSNERFFLTPDLSHVREALSLEILDYSFLHVILS